MPTYELRVTPRRASPHTVERLAEWLLCRGMPAASITELHADGRQQLRVYLATGPAARRWRDRLRAARLGATVRLRTLRAADWQEPWKRQLRPFAITRHLRIVPAWSDEARRGPDARRIVLETGLAFGTGKHTTTRWMAGFIAQLRGRFETVLDVGLGTGILAVVAARYGARRIVGADIQREAVQVAEHNLAKNASASVDVELFHADFAALPMRESFDLVVANIGASELLAMRERLVASVRPGRHLAVTGVLARQARDFRRRFAHPSLRCVRARADREWAAFLFQRRTSVVNSRRGTAARAGESAPRGR